MKKINLRRLQLNAQTLRNLNQTDLASVVGGGPGSRQIGCSTSCTSCYIQNCKMQSDACETVTC